MWDGVRVLVPDGPSNLIFSPRALLLLPRSPPVFLGSFITSYSMSKLIILCVLLDGHMDGIIGRIELASKIRCTAGDFTILLISFGKVVYEFIIYWFIFGLAND